MIIPTGLGFTQRNDHLGEIALVSLPGDHGGRELHGVHCISPAENGCCEAADIVEQQVRAVGVVEVGEHIEAGACLVEEHPHRIRRIVRPVLLALREDRVKPHGLGARGFDEMGQRVSHCVRDAMASSHQLRDQRQRWIDVTRRCRPDHRDVHFPTLTRRRIPIQRITVARSQGGPAGQGSVRFRGPPEISAPTRAGLESDASESILIRKGRTRHVAYRWVC